MADAVDVRSDRSSLLSLPVESTVLTSLALHETRLCAAKLSYKNGEDFCAADLVPLRAFSRMSSDYPVFIYTEMLEYLDAHVVRYMRSSTPPPLTVIQEVAVKKISLLSKVRRASVRRLSMGLVLQAQPSLGVGTNLSLWYRCRWTHCARLRSFNSSTKKAWRAPALSVMD